MLRKLLFTAAAAVLAPATAPAAFFVQLTSGGSSITIADNNVAGVPAAPAPIAPAGDTNNALNVITTAPAVPPATPSTLPSVLPGFQFAGYEVGFISVNSVNGSSALLTTNLLISIRNVSGTAPLTMQVTNNGLTVGAVGDTFTLENNLTLLQNIAGPNSPLLATVSATSTATPTLVTTTPVSFSGAAVVAGSSDAQFTRTGTPFTLFQTITITGLQAGGVVNFSADTNVALNAIPAPAGLVLLATAVPFAGLVRRRLRRTA